MRRWKKKAYQVLGKMAASSPYIRAAYVLFLCVPIVIFFIMSPYKKFSQDKRNSLIEMHRLSLEISKKKTWDKEAMKKYTLYKKLNNIEHKEKAALFELLREAQKKSEVDLEYIEQKEEERNNVVSHLTYKISVLGFFGNLANFLRNMTEIPVVMSFSEILMEPLDAVDRDDKKMLRLSLEIDIYREKE